MKKFTLAIAVLAIGVNAQEFPSPYCDPEETSIEEITSVDFGETNITNSDASAILIDKTSNVINVVPGETYTLIVKGNTYGNFDNDIVAFIDWDQNFTLDDEGEIYEIGTITNSTGDDEVFTTMDITIPLDAQLGTTRVRITKSYGDEDSPAEINPCAIEMDAFGMGAFPGYGQALDFTLNIETLGITNFEANALSVYPIPAKDVLNIDYKSTIKTVKIYNLLGQEVYTRNASDSQLKLDISRLNAGAYIVRILTEDGQHNFKIMKQ